MSAQPEPIGQPEPPALVESPAQIWSSCGPLDGLVRDRDRIPGTIGIHPGDPADEALPRKSRAQCGIAYAVGRMADRRGPIVVYRLTLGKSDISGRWICRCRRFELLGEAAEYVGEGRRRPSPDPYGWAPDPC